MASSRIQQLADTINTSGAKIQETLTTKGLPSPSFEENNPKYLPLEVSEAQDAAIDAATELRDLLTEPMLLIHGTGAHINSLCQEAIARFGIAAMVPSGGSLSFAEIAEKTGLAEQMVARLLRHAITMRIFYEPEPGVVAHTKASKILTDPVTNDWLRAGTEEMWPAATKVVDALGTYPKSEEPNETGFCLANNITDSIYAFLGPHPERAGHFGHAMAAYATKPEHDPAYITDLYDWASLGKALVVHVGGGAGYFAIALAKTHSNLRLVVQDVKFMMGPAEAGVPEQLKERVTFEEHDFFAPQTVEADAFFFRWSLRNWADKYCVLALRALIPKLKQGARVIIQDVILPEPGVGPLWKERNARSGDLSLAACFNARDRTAADWKGVLQEADKGFIFNKVTESKGSALGILEFVWEGKA